MNYKGFYTNAKRRLIETLVSMWAGGNVSYQNYFRYLLENEEKLFAEPVFQSTFPWESSTFTFAELNDVFSTEFITGINNVQDEEYRFPSNRHPYLLQELSWRALLNENKSIVVTSGTGSGKTECFMMPVLQDLMLQKESNAIQAIFLYPLNALIGSQKKRMSAWCEALGNIRYAVFNGKTPEITNSKAQNEKFPEIISRTQIRNQPPQILFTNPTMLEYMMVRDRDQSIINQSQGKLRWILLDEAHTFTGSAAAEIALLIRRVLDAFGVTAEEVRFAATSATISDSTNLDTTNDLKGFMSKLTGQPEGRIEIINGKRVKPEINLENLPEQINGSPIDPEQILTQRELLSMSANTCSEISNVQDVEEGLTIIDELSTPISGLLVDGSDGAIIPTRGHFFVRSMSGVHVCLNPECHLHLTPEEFQKNNLVIGSLSTNAKTKCACGSPMFELVRCIRCGEFLATGEINNQDNSYRAQNTDPNESIFDVENEPIPDGEETIAIQNKTYTGWSKIVLAKKSHRLHSLDSSTLSVKKVLSENEEERYEFEEGDPDGHLGYINSNPVCPCCKTNSNYFRHLRYSSGFLNRILSYTLLEQAPALKNNFDLIWEGRKYIVFTDSRQGTAKGALAQNIDIERIWIQSRILHFLSSKRLENIAPLTEEDRARLNVFRKTPNLFGEKIEELEGRQNAIENPDYIVVQPVSWRELYSHFIDDVVTSNELITLGRAIVNIEPQTANRTEVITDRHENYLKWLLFDQFSRRPKSANSPENLGFVRCVYPSLYLCVAPQEFLTLNQILTNSHWRDLLKICIDYYLRDNLFVDIPDNVFKFRTSSYFFRKRIYPSSFEVPDDNHRYLRWPSFNNTGTPNRIVLLLCKAAGWMDTDHLGNTEIDIINDLLQIIWRQLIKAGILRKTIHHGFAIQLDNSMHFEVLKEAWLCPITNVPLDVTFMGLSPRITGKLSPETFERFRILEDSHITYPCYPYANRIDNLVTNQEVENSTILSWMDQKLQHIKNKGLWSNMHERMYLKPEIYLAAEHSAQQDSKNLEKIEEKFEKGKLNILSCSTTMEMGVDIGGISEVVMNNVPPSPANYLQRAGRAGRRNETKSLSLTFCSPNPIGRTVMENPLWPLVHGVALPRVRFESPTIVNRHINSYLFSKFVTTQYVNQQGISITGKVEAFFGNTKEIVEDFISNTRFSEFRDFLVQLIHNHNDTINSGIKKIKIGTVIARQNNTDLISGCLIGINHVNQIYLDQLNELNNNITRLEEAGFNDNSPAIKSLHFKKGSLLGKPLLGYLAEKLFLPNANMPTGVVEFDISNSKNIQTRIDNQRRNNDNGIQENNTNYSISSENPSFHLARALSEYAPGRQIVLNQFCYTSAGVQLKSIWSAQSMLRIQRCANGHTSLSIFERLNCHCGAQYTSVHHGNDNNYTEAIEPAGFSVDIRSEPTRVIDNDQLSIIDTELINVSEWENDTDLFKLESRISLKGSEIMYYNNGNGFGYAVCIHCGRAEKEQEIRYNGDKILNPHVRLRGGRGENNDELCTGSNDDAFGIRRNTLLIGRLQTDFIELRFHDGNGYIVDKATVRSLGVVFSQLLAQCLGINQSEISFGVKNYHGFYSVYLYDTAKGGAGYSNQFNYHIEEILEGARNLLVQCDCIKACTKCLINRSSQWYLDELDRFKALDWLNIEFNTRTVVPDKISTISPDTKQVTREINSELHRWLDRSSSTELTIFIDNNSHNWDTENWKLYETVKEYHLVHHKTVNFVLLGTPNINLVTYSEIKGLKNWANVFVMNVPVQGGIIPLAIVKMESEGSVSARHFYSLNTNHELNETWGKKEIVFVDKKLANYVLTDYSPLLPVDANLILFYIYQRRASSKVIAEIFLQGVSEKNPDLWQKIITDFQNKIVTITYSDRYVVSKFNAILVLQFIKHLSQVLNLNIELLKMNFKPIREQTRPCNKVWDNWNQDQERGNFMKNALLEMEFVNEENFLINVETNSAHYRQLIIETEKNVITIQPDGGIAHGWRYKKAVADYHDGDYDLIENDENMEVYNYTQEDGIQYIVAYE
jgi:DEAD/DEAH box helicase domain-containing protein